MVAWDTMRKEDYMTTKNKLKLHTLNSASQLHDDNKVLSRFDESLKPSISHLISYARVAGADFVEFFFENRKSVHFRVENKKLTGLDPKLQMGVGIRIFKGITDCYVTTNDLSLKGLFSAVKRGLQILGIGDVNSHRILPEVNFEPFRDYGVVEKKDNWKFPNLKEVSQILLDLNLKEHEKIPYLQSSNINAFVDQQEILIASSEGTFARDIRLTQSLALQALCVDKDDRVSTAKRRGAASDPDFFYKIDDEALVHDLKESSQTMLRADYIEAGQYPVVLANQFGGVIFHEACGHLLETTAVQRKSTPFYDKKDQQIAHPCVSAWDEGLWPNAFGSLSMDDEGMPVQRTLLIENGILRNFLSDRAGQLLTGHPRTGSGRRESYAYAPASRMRNTYIAPSEEHTKEDLISSVEKGLYCKELGGGSVSSTGDFNFAVQEAYEIKDGKLGKPLKGATLIGDASNILKKISLVGNDLDIAAGFCGSVSGSIYVTVGQPHIKVDDITVGGR